MASVVRRERSPYFFACYYAADGRRLKKSTKQTERNKAMEIALTWERAEAAGRRGAFTEEQARKVLSEILERTTGRALISHTAEKWLRSWLEGKAVAKSSGVP